MGLLGFAIVVGLVSGITAFVRATLRRSEVRRRFHRELTARGIVALAGPAAMRIKPTPLLVGGPRPPTWSATVDGPVTLTFYEVGDGEVVVAWQSAATSDAVFALATGTARDVNPAPQLMREVEQIDGIRLFCNSPAAARLARVPAIVDAFGTCLGHLAGWYFTYEQGRCYLFSRGIAWHSVDAAMRTALAFEQALVTAVGR